MKTLTTTLSIFALLLSTTAFSSVSFIEIEPARRPQIPPTNISSTDSNEIEPARRPQIPPINIFNNYNA